LNGASTLTFNVTTLASGRGDRARELAVDEPVGEMPQEIGDQRATGQLFDQARDLLADARRRRSAS